MLSWQTAPIPNPPAFVLAALQPPNLGPTLHSLFANQAGAIAGRLQRQRGCLVLHAHLVEASEAAQNVGHSHAHDLRGCKCVGRNDLSHGGRQKVDAEPLKLPLAGSDRDH